MITGMMIDILEPLGVPVRRFVYSGDETTYITIAPYFQNSGLAADDDSRVEDHFLQVNIFSKGNYIVLADNVRATLKENRFIRLDEKETYEADTKYYHKIFRFLYRRNV